MTQPMTLSDAPKQFTADQDKILNPTETVRRVSEKLARLDLDVLAEVQRVDNGRLGIPVYFSRCGKDARATIGTKKQMGKGATPAQAEASAVMELTERFSFFSFCKNPTHFKSATFAEMGEAAIGYDQIVKSVHDDADEAEKFRPFFEQLPMKWTAAYNITRGKMVQVPFDWFFAINEFNGPSAGNCLEEAISQGICEIVERHVSALVSQKRLRVPGIDPASATDAMVREMLGKYEQTGIQLYLQDFSMDMGIPTVGALAWDPATFPDKSEIVWTAGTTPCPEKALSRTLTEVAQLAGDFNSGVNFVASGLPKFTHIDQADYITQPDTMVPLANLPDLSDNNIRIEVERLVAALAERDYEVLLIDTTHPLVAVPALYTIVPGAHFRERALNTSVGMFTAKLIAEEMPTPLALAQLTAMDQAVPNRYFLNFYLGYSYLAAEKPAEAVAKFQRALELDPPAEDRAAIYSYLGNALKDLGKYADAIAPLEAGLKIDAERTDLYNLLGFCHFKLGQHEAAIDAFKALLKLDPSSAIDYANIASNYRDMGNVPQAIEYYEMALALDPTITFAADNLMKLQESSNSN